MAARSPPPLRVSRKWTPGVARAINRWREWHKMSQCTFPNKIVSKLRWEGSKRRKWPRVLKKLLRVPLSELLLYITRGSLSLPRCLTSHGSSGEYYKSPMPGRVFLLHSFLPGPERPCFCSHESVWVKGVACHQGTVVRKMGTFWHFFFYYWEPSPAGEGKLGTLSSWELNRYTQHPQIFFWIDLEIIAMCFFSSRSCPNRT